MLETIITLFLLFLLVLTALLVARSNNLLVATLIVSIFSLLTASLFTVLDAPDVAFTEAAVGAGISTILFLAAIALTGHIYTYQTKNQLLALILASTVFVLLVYSISDLPPYADAAAPAHIHTGAYYLNHTEAEIGIPNTVTAVLASYRGFDTLGELTIIFTAGIGALAIFANRRRRSRNADH